MNSATPAGIATSRRPEKYRFYPGWTMLGIAALANYMSAPGQSHSVAAFKEPMRESLGITETNYSLAYGIGTLISGLLLPITGRLLDRFGARRVLPVVGLLLGAGCLMMSQATNLQGVIIGFSLIRILGQGALCLAAMWLVGEWFEQRRGFATAIAGLGGSISVMCFPLINGYLISHYNWQTAWAVLGIGVWVTVTVPSLLLVRDRPEELGLSPDGFDSQPARSKPAPSSETTNSSVLEGWETRDVLRDVNFWKLLSIPVTSGLVGTGLVFHQVSLLGSHDVSVHWALGLLSLQALMSTLAALGSGWLADRWECRYLLCVAMVFLALAVALVIALPWFYLVILYAVLLGLHGSVLRSAGMIVWMTYYGRRNQGTIRGCAVAMMIFGAALGPLPLALSIDYFGSYSPALYIFLIMPITAAVLTATVSQPHSQPVTEVR